MRELTKSFIGVFWSGWVGVMRQTAVTLGANDDVTVMLDSLAIAGDNIQRGVVDLVAGLVDPRQLLLRGRSSPSLAGQPPDGEGVR